MIEKNIDASILLGVYEAAVLLLKQNIEFVSKQGLTNQQWIVLIHLAKDPNIPFLSRENHQEPMMAYELADALGVTRANVTNLVKTLLEKKLVQQVEDKEDRRKKRLSLTKKAETLIQKMQPERKASNAKMLKGLTKKEKEEFLSLLSRCTQNILNFKS